MNGVTIIIPTKNEEDHLSSLLQSIQKQTHEPLETIVVDNASMDRSVSVAKKYGARVVTKGPERSAQRNYGAGLSAGSYLMFLDADMILTPTVVEECIAEFEKQKETIQGLVIPERSIGAGFWPQVKALERETIMGESGIEAARIFRKTVFDEFHGYDELLTGPEDYDLPQRIQHKYGTFSIGRLESAVLHDESGFTLGRTLKKKYYYGKKMAVYMKKKENRGPAIKQANFFYRLYLLCKKPTLVLRNPIVSLGLVFLRTCEYIALGSGFLVGLYEKK